MDYETEEQQVEALKTWWRENGRAVIAGIVLGIGGIAGWGLYQNHLENEAVAASDGWSRAQEAILAGDAATVNAIADELRDEHAGTLYAAYASLAAARIAVEAGNLDAAAERLAWAADEAAQDDVKLIATIRLARVDGARGQPDAGLERLPASYPDGFTGLVEEARGDLLVMVGDVDGARTAYDAAAESGQVADTQALTMKRDDLAVPASAS